MIIRFSERVKELREETHLTQAQLARELDVTRSSVNAWEMGLSLPSVHKLVQLAERFNTTTDYLLGIDDNRHICISEFSPQEQALLSNMMEYFNSENDH